jgi:hypothetical protein
MQFNIWYVGYMFTLILNLFFVRRVHHTVLPLDHRVSYNRCIIPSNMISVPSQYKGISLPLDPRVSYNCYTISSDII